MVARAEDSRSCAKRRCARFIHDQHSDRLADGASRIRPRISDVVVSRVLDLKQASWRPHSLRRSGSREQSFLGNTFDFDHRLRCSPTTFLYTSSSCQTVFATGRKLTSTQILLSSASSSLWSLPLAHSDRCFGAASGQAHTAQMEQNTLCFSYLP
jgi:hypothetical protein